MADGRFFRVNTPDVLHETIDGEVVLVNMKSGAYYSIDKIGATIWDLLTSGSSEEQIVEALMRQFDGQREHIGAGVARLLAQFRDEDLIVSSTDSDGSAAAAVLPDTSAATARPPFEAPVLQKYTDMQQLLLLDPIHEVDETGWPTEKRPDADPSP